MVQLVMAAAVLAAAGTARIPATPENVFDPLAPAARWHEAFAPKLGAVSLEPHAGCLDGAGPLPLTVAVYNPSGGPLTVDWDDLLAHVTLTPVGPGRVTARPAEKRGRTAVVPAGETAVLTVDLRERYTPAGGSVYRLDYAKPLPDGRLHVCSPTHFLVEDFAALGRWAAARWPADAAARAQAVELARINPLFAAGVVRPMWYDWHQTPPAVPWADSLAAARRAWSDFDRLPWDKPALPPAVAVGLFERAAEVSGGFAVSERSSVGEEGTPPVYSLAWRTIHPHTTDLSAADRRAVAVLLTAAKPRQLREFGIMALGSWDQSPEGGRVLLALADDPDPRVARKAVDYIGPYTADPQVVGTLRRKLADPDGRVAVAAACKLCFSKAADGTGLPVILRLTRHPDPGVRREAAGALISEEVYRHGLERAKAVVAGRLAVETDSGTVSALRQAAENYREAGRR